MNRLRALLGDRKRRQRGSILSSLLIIVAFLSILVGALMTELTSSFLISRTLVIRTQNEATVNSAAELAIHQLQGGAVPPVCARDRRGPWFLTLNGSTSAVTQSCQGIVPDLATGLAGGAFNFDGIHDTSAGHDRYLVTSSSGFLYSYSFGQTAGWSISVGGAPTAPPVTVPAVNGSNPLLLVPVASHSGCSGACVAVFNDPVGVPTFRCTLDAAGTVSSGPATEVAAAGAPNFPGYIFIADSTGRLSVYDDVSSCEQPNENRSFGGSEVGAPLVFTGPVRSRGPTTTVADEIFLLVNSGSATSLQQWEYMETTDTREGDVTPSLVRVGSTPLAGNVGGNATGYAVSSTAPIAGTPLQLVAAGAAGELATVQITMNRGPSYAATSGFTGGLPGGISRPPYWCHCPGGQDLIGVGSSNGSLYLLSAQLAIQWSYNGQADGAPAINTTPMADSNGDWYFGTNDGSVYDVEIPMSGPQMFKAAKFGPERGVIASSPIVGACLGGPCLYFASSTAGAYFAQLGGTRIIDLQACVSAASGSTTCAANPHLWARVEVGSPAILRGSGVLVQGWSFYSP